jgi:hypothetical protein
VPQRIKLVVLRRNLLQDRVQRNASSAISTHAAVAPIRVIVHHSVISFSAFLQEQQAIATYPPPAVTQDAGCTSAVPDLSAAIVNHDKIIARAAHFRELNSHKAPCQIPLVSSQDRRLFHFLKRAIGI